MGSKPYRIRESGSNYTDGGRRVETGERGIIHRGARGGLGFMV